MKHIRNTFETHMKHYPSALPRESQSDSRPRRVPRTFVPVLLLRGYVPAIPWCRTSAARTTSSVPESVCSKGSASACSRWLGPSSRAAGTVAPRWTCDGQHHCSSPTWRCSQSGPLWGTEEEEGVTPRPFILTKMWWHTISHLEGLNAIESA